MRRFHVGRAWRRLEVRDALDDALVVAGLARLK
jgi:hypothetical protein